MRIELSSRCGVRDLNPRCQLGGLTIKEVDLENFYPFLIDQNLSERWSKVILAVVRTFLSRVDNINKESMESYIKSFNNPNTYGSVLSSLKWLARFLDLPEPALPHKDVMPQQLIIAPSLERTLAFIKAVDEPYVKCYLGLGLTTGLRPEKLLNLTWEEIDFENSFIIPKNQNVRTKHYRPNPLHPIIKKWLMNLPKERERIFHFTEHKVRITSKRAGKVLGYRIRPSEMRDAFYNIARKAGMDRDIIEWLMGHSLGIKQHYLADTIKEEYQKFIDMLKLD